MKPACRSSHPPRSHPAAERWHPHVTNAGPRQQWRCQPLPHQLCMPSPCRSLGNRPNCSWQVLYNGGSLADYLGKVKTWMDANPNDGTPHCFSACSLGVDNGPPVVSLLMVNSNGVTPARFGDIFAGAGLDKMSYSPPTAQLGAKDWPTLGSLIDAGTRLVTFMDSRADFTAVPYIIDGTALSPPSPPYSHLTCFHPQSLQTSGRQHSTSSTRRSTAT